jgi:hypothetical protein
VPRGRAKSARLRSRAGRSQPARLGAVHGACTAERPPPERKPVGRAQVPPNARNRPETDARDAVREQVRDAVRDESRTPTGPDGGNERGGETSWSPLPRHPRRARDSGMGQRPRLDDADRNRLKPRGDAGAARAVESVEMRTSSVEGKSHPKPNREQDHFRRRAPDGRSPGRICGWHLGRVASRERTGREAERDQKPGP